MRIQPISTNQLQTCFEANKLPKPKGKQCIKNIPKDQEWERTVDYLKNNDLGSEYQNFVPSIIVALTLCFIANATYLVNRLIHKNRESAPVEVVAKPHDAATDSTMMQFK